MSELLRQYLLSHAGLDEAEAVWAVGHFVGVMDPTVAGLGLNAFGQLTDGYERTERMSLLYTLGLRDPQDTLAFFNDRFDLGSLSMQSVILK